MDFGDFSHGTNVGGGSPKALQCRVMLWQHGITQCNDQGRPLWEEITKYNFPLFGHALSWANSENGILDEQIPSNIMFVCKCRKPDFASCPSCKRGVQ